MPLDISEYRNLAEDGRGRPLLAGAEPSIRTQQVAIGGTSTVSEPFGSGTFFVRLHADSGCRWAVGENPVATPTSPRLAGGATEFIGVREGHRIAVLQAP